MRGIKPAQGRRLPDGPARALGCADFSRDASIVARRRHAIVDVKYFAVPRQVILGVAVKVADFSSGDTPSAEKRTSGRYPAAGFRYIYPLLYANLLAQKLTEGPLRTPAPPA
jgi:hypothetical protein